MSQLAMHKVLASSPARLFVHLHHHPSQHFASLSFRNSIYKCISGVNHHHWRRVESSHGVRCFSTCSFSRDAPRRRASQAKQQHNRTSSQPKRHKSRPKRLIVPGQFSPSSKKSPTIPTTHTKVNLKFTTNLQADYYAQNFTALKRLHEIKMDYEDEISQVFKTCHFVNAYNQVAMLPRNTAAIEMGTQRTVSAKTPWSDSQMQKLLSVAQNTPLREIAFIGRSNVGKSSLLSSLVKNPKGLVRISKTPGRTQMLNYFRVGVPLVDTVLNSPTVADQDRLKSIMYLVDMPGYGYARAPKQVSDEWVGLVKDYFVKRSESDSPLLMTYLLIDAQLNELKFSDKQFLQLFHEYQIPYTIVLTKIDKASKDDLAFFIARILTTLTEEFGVSQNTLPLIVPTSSFANRNIGLLRMLTYQYCFLNKGLPVEYFAKPVPIIHHHDTSKKKAQEAEAEGIKIFKIPRGERSVQSKVFSRKPYVSSPKLVSKTEHRSQKDQKTYIRIMRHHGVFHRKKKELKKRQKFIY